MTLYQKDILGKHIFQDAKDIGSIEKVIYNTDIGVVAGFVLNNQILIHSIDIYIDESGIFHIHDTYKINDPYLQELSTQNQHFIGKQVVDIDNKTL
ncbi:MAG: hypothetical protein U9Q15_02120 [Patescibacteria group bacterium]|nr:hypothetical protein [Patescibacteria group bacterium]